MSVAEIEAAELTLEPSTGVGSGSPAPLPPDSEPRRDPRWILRHRLRRRRDLRAADRSLQPRDDEPVAAQERAARGAGTRPLVRRRPARTRRVLTHRLRRTLLPLDRRRRGLDRVVDRHRPRIARRLHRRLRRLADHARDGRHARHSRSALRDRDRGDARPGPRSGDDRRRRRQYPDLRPSSARLDPGPARERFRLSRARGRSEA